MTTSGVVDFPAGPQPKSGVRDEMSLTNVTVPGKRILVMTRETNTTSPIRLTVKGCNETGEGMGRS